MAADLGPGAAVADLGPGAAAADLGPGAAAADLGPGARRRRTWRRLWTGCAAAAGRLPRPVSAAAAPGVRLQWRGRRPVHRTVQRRLQIRCGPRRATWSAALMLTAKGATELTLAERGPLWPGLVAEIHDLMLSKCPPCMHTTDEDVSDPLCTDYRKWSV